MGIFTDTKNPGDLIESENWNSFVDFTEDISSMAYKHSSNADIHISPISSQKYSNAYASAQIAIYESITSLSGPMAGNIGSDITYGISGLSFLSSQSISGGTAKLAGTTIDSTFTTNWTDLTDGGTTTLHTHTGISSFRTPSSYIVYTENGLYHAISGETGVDASSNCERADILFNYITQRARERGGADIYISPGEYWMSGEFWIPNNTRIHGAGNLTKFWGDYISNSEIVISGSNISLKDFSFVSSMRLTCRQYGDEGKEWHDITLENINARNINTSGHRGTFEDDYWDHMIHGGHNIGAFNFRTGVKNGVIHDIRILNCSLISSTSFGFSLHGNGGVSGSYYNVWVENCLTQGIGFNLKDSNGYSNTNYAVGYSFNENTNYVHDIFVKNCIARRIWRSGFHSEFNPEIYNITYDSCIAEDCGMFLDWYNAGLYSLDDVGYGDCFKGMHSGTTLVNCKAIKARGIGISGRGISILNCIIEGGMVTSGAIDLYGRETGDNKERAVIKNNIVRNCWGTNGIVITWCSSSIISDNSLMNVGISGTGINVVSLVGQSTVDNNVLDYDFSLYPSSCTYGIRVGANGAAGDGIIISNNRVSHAKKYGISVNAPKITVDGNTIYSGGASYYASINIAGLGTEAKVINNKVYNWAGNGISSYANRSIIDNNTLINTGRDAAIVIYSNLKDIIVSNNYISGCGYGIYMSPGCSHNQIIDNMIMNVFGGYSIFGLCSSSRIDGNFVNESSSLGGILIFGKSNIIENNYVNHCNTNGITISGNFNIVRNNTSIDDFVSKIQNKGVYEYGPNDDTGYHNYIIGNYVSGNSSEQIDANNPLTIVKDNIGYTTENGGWASVSDGGTISHGCDIKPNKVMITPSGSTPVMYSFKVDSTNITVYHSSPDAIIVSWLVEV